MKSYENPFRVRASEHYRDAGAFLSDFEAGALDLLPNGLWERPLVIRSAPGAGKTSLMRAFSAESVKAVMDRPEDFIDLENRFKQLGMIVDGQPRYSGVLINLSTDYRALADLGSETATIRLFFRLLNARIAMGVISAVLALYGKSYPRDASHVRLEPGVEAADALERIGGGHGEALLAASRAAEADILDLVDSLAPIDVEESRGHADLYALRALDGSRVFVDNREANIEPLVMLDDGHELAPRQREHLLRALTARHVAVPRWYSERYEALAEVEVIKEAGTPGRDYLLLEIETAARSRGSVSRKKVASSRFDDLLLEIADRRARGALQTYADEKDQFRVLLKPSTRESFDGRSLEVVLDLVARLDRLGEVAVTYSDWLRKIGIPDPGRQREEWIARVAASDAQIIALRCMEILIARDRRKSRGQLFDESFGRLPEKDLQDSNLRDAARLFLSREFSVPYYAGPDMLARLASRNVEQLLTLGGNLFEEMLAMITLRVKPRVTARRQHELLLAGSESLWRGIVKQVPHGRDVQLLLLAIAGMSRKETYRETAPYAPGVSGTALSMEDKDALLRSDVRSHIQGADRLLAALSSSIAFNLVEAEMDQHVKGRRWMVLYLNRLLCPRFGLTLRRGGFRERPLRTMAEWLANPEMTPEDLGQLTLT